MALCISDDENNGQAWHQDTFVQGTVTHDHTEESKRERVDEAKRPGSGNAAILQLPVETMVEIFKLSQLVSELKDHSADSEDEESDWRWTTVTHICKYWRDIAINMQELWTYINISKDVCPEEIGLYLERSGSLPLDVYYNGAGLKFYADESLRLTLRHIHRIRKLHIKKLGNPQDVDGLIDHPAPILVEFSLEMDHKYRIDFECFFAGQAPKLTRLSLNAYSDTWENIPIMKNLRHLIIASFYPLDLVVLLYIISQNPECESLSVSSLQVSLGDFEEHPHITMSSLKDLDILHTSYTAISQLYQIVDFPAVDNWNIVCDDFPFKTDDDEPVNPKSVIPGSCTTDCGPQSLKLAISSKSAKIAANSLSDGINGHLIHRSITYRWGFLLESISHEDGIKDGFKFIRSAIIGDFWCSTTELTLKVASPGTKVLQSMGVGSEKWKLLLEILPQLRKLSVKHVWKYRPEQAQVARTETHYGLFSALGSRPEDNGNGKMISPELSELHLCGFDLRDADGVIRTLEFLKDRIRWGKQLSLLRVTDLPKRKHTHTNLHLLKDSGVARTIDVVI